MKLKKLLAAGLSVALGLSLSAPALASEAGDRRGVHRILRRTRRDGSGHPLEPDLEKRG